MNIFISTPWFMPAFRAGGPVQSLANMVSEKWDNLKFDVFTSNMDMDGSSLSVPAVNDWIAYNERTKVFYSTNKGVWSHLRAALKERGPDVIYIVGIYSFIYTVLPLFLGKGRPLIISARGMLHSPALRQKRIKKKIYLFFFRMLAKNRAAVFHATDEEEKRQILNAMGKWATVKVAGNIPGFIEPSRVRKIKGDLILVTVALISPMKNHLMVLKALALSKARIRYDIIGPVFDESYWQKCLDMIRELPGNIKVEYHGAVEPNVIRHYLSDAHVFICPSQSENFGHALLEALSAGKPLVTSFNTPWKELKSIHAGWNTTPEPLGLKESIDFFSNMDQDDYDHWSRCAAAYARSSFDKDKVGKEYLELFSID